MADIAVVIPYFQREPGVLLRALRSVQGQTAAGAFPVFVVDDSSPIPASEDIAALPADFRDAIEVIPQPNGGPGSARNRALAALPSSIKYVAFLDSDDEWTPDHLANGMRALAAGYHVYFANHLQLGQTTGAFERAGRIRPDEHPRIAGCEFLHEFRGDMLCQIVLGNVIGTSTVLFDCRAFPDQRFRTDFRNAGEDYLFWMDLAAGSARFAFSEKTEAVYGKGVNVYSGAGWGTEAHLRRLIDELRYRKASRREYRLAPAIVDHIRQGESNLRVAIVRDLLHRGRHMNPPRAGDVGRLLRVDPGFAALAVPIAARLALARRNAQES